jgi:NADPH-dependent 2,4-dienoyl-CoA reductase/sulfur reductase-like enzyme
MLDTPVDPHHVENALAAGRNGNRRSSRRRGYPTCSTPLRPRSLLANIWFGHIGRIGERVVVIGGGNTAMDCTRSARRLGGEDVRLVVRSPFAEMKAAPWEREDVQREGITIHDNLVPKEFIVDDGRVTAVMFQPVKAVYENGHRRLLPTGASLEPFPCDDVIIAIGEEPAFPWIERDLGIAFGERGLPKIDPVTFPSTSVLRRRRGLRPQEYHHGRRPRARGGYLPRPLLKRR